MKRYVFMLIFALILLASCGGKNIQSIQQKNDIERLGLKGAVRKMVSFNKNAGRTRSKFDREGSRISIDIYSKNDELVRHTTYKYSPDKKKIFRKVLNHIGDIQWEDTTTYYYDQFGRLYEKIRIGKSGELLNRVAYSYSTTNNNAPIYEESHYDKSDRQINTYRYIYDGNKNIIETIRFDENKEYCGKFGSIFKNGLEILVLKYDVNTNLEWKEQNTYDSHYNKIKSIRIDTQGNEFEKNVHTYDSIGNKTKWSFYDDSGKLISEYQYTYTYWDTKKD